MPDPLVSVIFPIYNVERFVRAAAESVLSQSWRDLELIAVDDGSEDGTAAEIERFDDPRVILLRRQHQGAAAARNTGLACARGRYVSFMDGDDVWLESKLEEDIRRLESHPGIDLVFSAMRMVNEDGRDIARTVRRWSGVLALRDLLIENMIGTDTVLMRREACAEAGRFDEHLTAGSDYEYWIRVALLRPNNIHGSAEVTALYRRRAGQLTGNWRQQQDVWMQIMAKVRAECPDEFVSVESTARANFQRALSATAYENGELESASELFQEAMQLAPGFLLKDKRTWLLGSALLSARVLPSRMHQRLEASFRSARARIS